MFPLAEANMRVYTRFMTLTECLCARLRLAASATTDFYDRALAPTGLTLTTYRLLRHLERLDGASITRLAHSMELDRSTLGRNVKLVEKRGLVKTVPATVLKDKRQTAYQLTPDGAAVLARAVPLWEQAQNDIAKISEGEAPALLAALNRLTWRLENKTHE
ncbi:MAG: MarR family winged helix-turn-helix transcriptional regulator [Pseudomonadota bacterium]